MIVNRYENKVKQFIKLVFGKNNCVLWWHILRYKRPVEQKIRSYMQNGELMFQKVEIETVNRCNGRCSFCPVNHNAVQRPYARMTDALFERIIQQLGEMDHSGELALYSNNEPFLDTRIVDYARMAREKVPHAFIHLSSNGSVLTKEKALDVIPYLDRLIINNYDDELKMNAVSQELNALCEKDPELNCKIEIHLRKVNEILFTRGGQSPNNQRKRVYPVSCILPYIQLVIRPTGEVSLCCCDALGKYTLGNCNHQSLIDIWRSPEFFAVREKLLKGRGEIELCKYCDHFVNPEEYE